MPNSATICSKSSTASWAMPKINIADLEQKRCSPEKSDHLNAIMTIKPGAGGTESQDWASILLRMYLRWAERKRMSAIVLDETPGEEAGSRTRPSSSPAKRLRHAHRRSGRASPRPHLSV